MADVLKFELVSPERKLAEAEVDAVTVPGQEGDLTAMVNHAPFLTSLRPGYVVVQAGSTETQYFVTGGFAEISAATVSVLADEAVEAGDVNRAWLDDKVAEAEKAHADAEDDRRQAALQKLNDYKTLAEHTGA